MLAHASFTLYWDSLVAKNNFCSYSRQESATRSNHNQAIPPDSSEHPIMIFRTLVCQDGAETSLSGSMTLIALVIC